MRVCFRFHQRAFTLLLLSPYLIFYSLILKSNLLRLPFESTTWRTLPFKDAFVASLLVFSNSPSPSVFLSPWKEKINLSYLYDLNSFNTEKSLMDIFYIHLSHRAHTWRHFIHLVNYLLCRRYRIACTSSHHKVLVHWMPRPCVPKQWDLGQKLRCLWKAWFMVFFHALETV